MTKKVMFITNFTSKAEEKNCITSFSRAAFEVAKQLGYEFHINTNNHDLKPMDEFTEVLYHRIGVYRNPISLDVLKAYKELIKVCKEESFDIIHCNTPIGGVVGRLAAKRCGIKKVIYEAHGFHFYKGAPLRNWLIYYLIERLLAHITDYLLTINKEDYSRAKSFHYRSGGTAVYIPGVGIDLNRFVSGNYTESETISKREELGLGINDFVLITVGELNSNKNQKVLIDAVAKANNPRVHLLICGKGEEEPELRGQSGKLGIADNVHFLGYRSDIDELLRASDAFVMSSKREGLSRSIMEAMAAGLPCVVSDIRGNRDLIDKQGGYLCDYSSAEEYSKAIETLLIDIQAAQKMGKKNEKTVNQFSMVAVMKVLNAVYSA